MSHRIPHTQPPVEAVYEHGLIECGTLTVLLEAVGKNATVLLTPLERSFQLDSSRLAQQFVLHVTARGTEATSPIYYCTFVAAEVVSANGRGHLLLPVKELLDDAAVLQRAHTLHEGLQECLKETLRADPRVATLRTPARYRLPDAWVWSAKSTLVGSGIAYYEGHWTRIVISR